MTAIKRIINELSEGICTLHYGITTVNELKIDEELRKNYVDVLIDCYYRNLDFYVSPSAHDAIDKAYISGDVFKYVAKTLYNHDILSRLQYNYLMDAYNAAYED